jgi:zinc protease
VVGDITLEEIVKLAEKYIEPIPSRGLPQKVTTREPEQLGERRVEVRKFAQLPILMMGYHVPESGDPDYYPLQVLKTVLFEGQSSRMYQRLIEKDQLAISVQADYSFAFDPTLFTVTVRPKAGVRPDAAEKSIYDELDRVKAALVTDRELEKAKNILLADFYRRMKTIDGKARALGSYEVFFGDYHRLFDAADSYNKVTKEDLQRVAQKYFAEKNRTVATLIPEQEETK